MPLGSVWAMHSQNAAGNWCGVQTVVLVAGELVPHHSRAGCRGMGVLSSVQSGCWSPGMSVTPQSCQGIGVQSGAGRIGIGGVQSGVYVLLVA